MKTRSEKKLDIQNISRYSFGANLFQHPPRSSPNNSNRLHNSGAGHFYKPSIDSKNSKGLQQNGLERKSMNLPDDNGVINKNENIPNEENKINTCTQNRARNSLKLKSSPFSEGRDEKYYKTVEELVSEEENFFRTFENFIR